VRDWRLFRSLPTRRFLSRRLVPSGTRTWARRWNPYPHGFRKVRSPPDVSRPAVPLFWRGEFLRAATVPCPASRNRLGCSAAGGAGRAANSGPFRLAWWNPYRHAPYLRGLASLATRCLSGLGRSLSVPSDWNLTVMSGGAPLRLSRLAGAVSVWASRLSLRGTSLTREKLVQVWDTMQHHLAIRPHFGGADRPTPLYLQGFPDRKNLSKKSQKNPQTSPRTATGPTPTPRADPVRLTSSSWPQAAHRHGTSPPESPRGARP
jgi:hypothetical protein